MRLHKRAKTLWIAQKPLEIPIIIQYSTEDLSSCHKVMNNTHSWIDFKFFLCYINSKLHPFVSNSTYFAKLILFYQTYPILPSSKLKFSLLSQNWISAGWLWTHSSILNLPYEITHGVFYHWQFYLWLNWGFIISSCHKTVNNT